MRIFFIALLIILIIAIAAVFIYRYKILQYSAEQVIRRALPDYVRIDKINLIPKDNSIVFANFKILNPKGFSDKYLLEIEDITCRYKMIGKNMLEGFEILEPSFRRPTLNIERLKSGTSNLEAMAKTLEKASKEMPPQKESKPIGQGIASKIIGHKSLHEIIKLPQTFIVNDGKVIFIDRMPYSKGHMITFEKIEARLSITLDNSYAKVLSLSTEGEGRLNGNQDEVIRWTISLNPLTPKLTMSNRFEVSGMDILSFEPYYDRYSPLVFKKGKFSGTLIFDFDNGNIGSTNEVRLSDILFYIKHGWENAEFWETSVPDLAKYLTSSFGEIIFDFKIKGEMSNPKFYLGPISKQALASMAIGKLSDIIGDVAGASAKQGADASKTGVEKAKEYIELFKGLIKK